MSRIHFRKRRDFLKGATCAMAAGGISTLFPQLSMLPTANAGTGAGYKALVCIYLDGGNDSWNLVIPATAARHAEYVAARGGLYQGAGTSLAVPITGGGGALLPNALALNGTVGGNSYAMNPFVAATPTNAASNGVHLLYNTGRLAVIANAGPLVVPLRKSTFNSSPRPPQLYSHSDQTNLWMIGGGSNSASPNGWGGMVAGQVAGPNALNLPPCISVAGQTRFLIGTFPGGSPVIPYRVSTSNTNPATSLSNYATNDTAGQGNNRREALTTLINNAYPDVFSTEYSDIVERSLALSTTVNTQISGLPNDAFATALNAFPNTSLGNQLKQVARMIRISRGGTAINANRQVFFVRTGGYDTHDAQITSATAANGHHGLLQQLSQAMFAFNNAMNALNGIAGFSGVYNEVVTFTMSEFSRTLNSNGDGTDHAYGGVSLVMGAPVSAGGPLNGGTIYGPFPRQVLGLTQNDASPLPAQERGECFNRGEFIPRVAVDQIAATFARWFGMSDSELPGLLPNIDNFVSHPNASLMGYQSRTVPFLNF